MGGVEIVRKGGTRYLKTSTGIYLPVGAILANDVVVRDASTNLVGLSPGASGSVLGSNGTAWVAAYGQQRGLDQARPDASSSVLNGRFYATDTGVLYYCDSATTWRVESANMGPDKASIGPWATTTALICAATAGAGPICTSFALMFYPTGTPTGSETLVDRLNNPRGITINIGADAGDRSAVGLYVMGVGQVPPNIGTFSTLLNQVHCLAGAFVGADLHTSWDGAAVVVSANYTLTPAQAADPLEFGERAGGSQGAVSARHIGFIGYSSVIADADLRVLSGAAARAAMRFPTIAGATIDFPPFYASQFVEGVATTKINGELFTVGAVGANPNVLRKWAH